MIVCYCRFFVLLVASAVIYGLGNVYYWVEKDHVQVHVIEASHYVSENLVSNETLAILFTENYFNMEMMKFFLLTSEQDERELWDYPERVIDVHTPIFKEACLIEQYKVLDVKFLVVYEHGDRIYYQSDWKSYNVLEAMFDSGSLTLVKMFGTYPQQIVIIRYFANS